MEIIKVIHNWNSLEEFGIDLLTGEACGYAMRLLCDLTMPGKLLMERFLGGNVEIKVGSSWNGGSKAAPHVASILLPREIFKDLAAFCLLETYPTAWVCTHSGDFFAGKGEIPGDFHNFYPDTRWFRRPREISTGRNTHTMSGRTT